VGFAFTPDGQGVATMPRARWTASDFDIDRWGSGRVVVFDIRSGKVVEEPLWTSRTLAPITSAAFAPDGRSLAVGEADLVVVEGMEGQKHIDDNDPKEKPKPLAMLQSPFYFPPTLSFSGDGRRLAASYRTGEVVVWDVESRPDAIEGRRLEGHIGLINSMDFSPDGRRLATAGADKTVRLWDMQLGKQALVLQGHKDSVLAVSFSADGQQITSVSQDGILRRWDGGIQLPVETRAQQRDWVRSLCFSPDEKLLASGTADGYVQLVQLWEIPTFRPVGSVRVLDYVSSAAFRKSLASF
jgi:hypothetical protein